MIGRQPNAILNRVGKVYPARVHRQKCREQEQRRQDGSLSQKDRIPVRGPRRGLNDGRVSVSALRDGDVGVDRQALPQVVFARMIARRIVMQMEIRRFDEARE